MFYVNSSTAGGRLSHECRDDELTHFMRRLLDYRTATLASQLKWTDEVYPTKHRLRRSDSTHGFSAAADPLDATDLASSLFKPLHGDKLEEGGSGEPVYPEIPTVDEISEGFVDSAILPSVAQDGSTDQHRTQIVPYASVVFPQQSTTLRTFPSYDYNHNGSLLLVSK